MGQIGYSIYVPPPAPGGGSGGGPTAVYWNVQVTLVPVWMR